MRRFVDLARLCEEEHPSRILAVAKAGHFEVLEGAGRIDSYSLREFPSMQAAIDLYRSPAYQRAAAVRRAATQESEIVILEGI
jgi:uncharacterized protein (DUF1330 family)